MLSLSAFTFSRNRG